MATPREPDCYRCGRYAGQEHPQSCASWTADHPTIGVQHVAGGPVVADSARAARAAVKREHPTAAIYYCAKVAQGRYSVAFTYWAA